MVYKSLNHEQSSQMASVEIVALHSLFCPKIFSGLVIWLVTPHDSAGLHCDWLPLITVTPGPASSSPGFPSPTSSPHLRLQARLATTYSLILINRVFW